MKEIIAALSLMVTDLRDRANNALKQLGPLDQIDAGQDILCALRGLNWSIEDLKKMEANLNDASANLEKWEKKMADDAIAASIASGDLVKKVDHENAVVAAENKIRAEVTSQFEGQIAAQKLATERRSEAVTKFGAVIAAALTDEVLVAPEKPEDFAALSAEVERRVVACKKINLDPEKADKAALVTSIVCCAAFDVDGAKEFDTRIDSIRAASGLKPAAEDNSGPTGTVHASRQFKPGGGAPIVTPAPARGSENEPAKAGASKFAL